MAHIRHASVTFDEGPHLAIGYTTLRTGDFRLQPVHIHPPLANVIAAAPLLLQQDLPDPTQIDGWEINSLSAVTDAIVWQYPNPRHIATAARVPILLMGILLGALVFRWAGERGGPAAGMLAIVLYSLDPNCIAHGSLVTTDMAASLLMVATLYAAGRTSLSARKRRLLWILVTGLLLGLAQLTKVSAAALVPIVALVLAWDAFRSPHSRRRQALGSFFGRAVLLFGVAVLVVWAGYGFRMEPALRLPFPIPLGTHLRIYQSLQEHYGLGHPTFAIGRVSTHGWAWYFPLAFAIKTPLPTLALFAGSLAIAAAALRRRLSVSLLTITCLAFPLLYAATSLLSSVNIGYRHLLPLLPFIFMACGVQWAQLQSRVQPQSRRWIRLAGLTMGMWLAGGTFAVTPHPLTFFNEVAAGPAQGYRYLVDSNLDWGQNLWDLRTWMEQHAVDHIYYAHYSPARLEPYGISGDYLPPDPRASSFTPWAPAPGTYVIGATVLQGPYAPNLNTYAWFRDREPTARLGNALFVYHVGPIEPAAWAVLCSQSGLSVETVRANLGQPTLRVLQPDCTSARVYAAGPGVVVSAAGELIPEGQADFDLRTSEGHEPVHITRIEQVPVPGHILSVMTYGPLDFLGYDTAVPEADSEILLRTYWRVKERPTRPLSLMAHLAAPDGATQAIGDAMGFPIDQWEPGDTLIQQHRLPEPPGTGYTLRIGGYWLDTMERWSSDTDEGQGYWEISQ